MLRAACRCCRWDLEPPVADGDGNGGSAGGGEWHMVVKATSAIDPGEELLLSYGAVRRRLLHGAACCIEAYLVPVAGCRQRGGRAPVLRPLVQTQMQRPGPLPPLSRQECQ